LDTDTNRIGWWCSVVKGSGRLILTNTLQFELWSTGLLNLKYEDSFSGSNRDTW